MQVFVEVLPEPANIRDVRSDFPVAPPWAFEESCACESRRGDRVADCAGLENQCIQQGTEGSNPSLSALRFQFGFNQLRTTKLIIRPGTAITLATFFPANC